MTNIEILKTILDEKYKYDKDTIEEVNTNCKIEKFVQSYKIECGETDVEYQIYKYDDRALPFFKDVRGLKKMCDYILFTQWNTRFKVFLIELKLTNGSAQQQLEASSEFAKYILKSAKRLGFNIMNLFPSGRSEFAIIK